MLNVTNLIHQMTVDKILEYIESEVESGSRLEIDKLKDYSGYSRRHLQRLFKKVTGLGLGEYIRRRRLNRAALLLRFSLRSYQDIALSVGFDSQQSFNRAFKKFTGISPGQYRSRPEWILSPLIGIMRNSYCFESINEVYKEGGL